MISIRGTDVDPIAIVEYCKLSSPGCYHISSVIACAYIIIDLDAHDKWT